MKYRFCHESRIPVRSFNSAPQTAPLLATETALLHGTGSLALTLPWVLLGTGRYLYRLRLRGGGGDPAEELLRDPLMAVSVAGWTATVVWLIG